MAWIDDRIWCHPKFNGLTDKAFCVWVNSVAWSCGFQTKGTLTPADQKRVGGNPKVRAELVAAGLWDTVNNNGLIVIHDWDEHNGKRDQARAANTERKRRQRQRDNGVTEA